MWHKQIVSLNQRRPSTQVLSLPSPMLVGWPLAARTRLYQAEKWAVDQKNKNTNGKRRPPELNQRYADHSLPAQWDSSLFQRIRYSKRKATRNSHAAEWFLGPLNWQLPTTKEVIRVKYGTVVAPHIPTEYAAYRWLWAAGKPGLLALT